MYSRTLAAAWLGLLALAAAAPANDRPEGFDPRRHIAVDEVQPGMIGYGLTVYHGTEIETFDVEVVSVERGWQPGKSVVWVRCTDERMQKLGPVSGMSGSPIYLWPVGTRRGEFAPGDGGRMLGAFAYGYSLGKDCFAGIQPIEQMLAASSRAAEPNHDAPPPPGRGSGQGLARLLAAAQASDAPERATWRTEALAELLKVEPAKGPASHAQGRRRLMLPVMIGGSHAERLRPLLEPMGLTPVTAGGGSASTSTSGSGGGPTGLPPRWINPRNIPLEPGGVASVPLVMGDMDLPAVGTITEVLRDDAGRITRILAFGHAFNATGATNLPFATGYVHYVQPNLSASFKLGGSGQVIGALVNDESSAVVAAPDIDHPFAPAKVTVDWPGESKDRTFNYQLAREPYYTPILAAYTAVLSLNTDTEIPPYHTIESNAVAHFDNGRSLNIRSLLPGGASFGILYDMASPLMTIGDNPFGQAHLERIETTVTIHEDMQSAEIVDLAVRQPRVAPGGRLRVEVQMMPFRGEKVRQTIAVDVPKDAAEGSYILMVGGAQMYWRRYLEAHPHLQRIHDADALFDMVERMASMRSDALYVLLRMSGQGEVAVGRRELPNLPSSRRAMLLQPTSTAATAYLKTIEQVKPLDYVIQGQMQFPVVIERKPGQDD